MGSFPVIERQCKHDSKKVVRREFTEGFLITAVDLCAECKDDPVFYKKADFVDKKIIPRKTSKTKSAIKKKIMQRKKELEKLQSKDGDFWTMDNVFEKTPKLLEHYICTSILKEELNSLYENYIEKIEQKKAKISKSSGMRGRENDKAK